MTRAQTLLWFFGGIAGMFLVVSIAFAIKLANDGRVPFLKTASLIGSASANTNTNAAPAPAPPVSETVSPPVSASTVTGNETRSFVSGSENLLPPEAAHLAKLADPTASPPHSPPAAAPAPAANAAITAALQGWATAWSAKDVDNYLKHYTADFQPLGGLSHEAWVKQRQQRLARPEAIAVSIAELEVLSAGSTATARFTQTYRAGAQTLREAKTLELVLAEGEWRISQERIGR